MKITAKVAAGNTTVGSRPSRAVWKNYAEDMLYARAMSRLARRLFPDVIGTAYVEGEIGDSQIKKESPSDLLAEVIEISEVAKETQDQTEQRLLDFISQFNTEDWEYMRTYITKYADHYKRSMAKVLDHYSDQEKFLTDFMNWKRKRIQAPHFSKIKSLHQNRVYCRRFWCKELILEKF